MNILALPLALVRISSFLIIYGVFIIDSGLVLFGGLTPYKADTLLTTWIMSAGFVMLHGTLVEVFKGVSETLNREVSGL